MLDVAYGRVGKLRRELIEVNANFRIRIFEPHCVPQSLLSDPSLNPPSLSPTNSRKDESSWPVYSPELAALLTSGISRTTKALQKQHLVSPPGSTERPKFHSEGIVLLGLPSRRREYNIRWRFFKNECKKVYPPLQISLDHPGNHIDARIFSNPPVAFGFQNAATLQELLVLAGTPSKSPRSPDEQKMIRRFQHTSDTNLFDGKLPVRWLRRRYQALLGRIPLLVLRPSSQDNPKHTYDVQWAPNAITTSRVHPSRLCTVDAADVSWIGDVNLMAQSGECRK